MTTNFKKRMLSDYKSGSQTITEGEDGSEDSVRVPQAPLKRLRLTAKAVYIDVKSIGSAVEARRAVTDLRQQLQVSLIV